MGRRKSPADHLMDDLFDLLRHVPWWVGPILIAVVFVSFRYVVPALFFSTPPSPDLSSQISKVSDPVFRRLSIGMAPILAGIVAVMWMVAEASKFARRRMFDAQTGLDTIRQLSWRQFEELLAEAYRRQGYQAEVTGGSAAPDGGIDIVLRRAGEKRLVQCKHWKWDRVGVKPIRELEGVVSVEGAHGGIFVTSGTFTDDARRFAARSKIELVDGKALVQLIGDIKQEPQPAPAPRPAVAQPQQPATPLTAQSVPACPQCGAHMVLHTAKRGSNPGSQFWGCSQFAAKKCRGKRQVG